MAALEIRCSSSFPEFVVVVCSGAFLSWMCIHFLWNVYSLSWQLLNSLLSLLNCQLRTEVFFNALTGRSPILCQGTLCVCWAKFQHSIRLQLCLCLHFLLEWSLKVSERWETGVLLGLSLHRHVYSRSPGICWSVLKLLWTVHPLDFHLSCWVSFLLLQLVLPP